MDPINYMLDVKNPIEEAIKGYTMGRNDIAQRQELQIQQQNATMAQKAFEDQQTALAEQRAAAAKQQEQAAAYQQDLMAAKDEIEKKTWTAEDAAAFKLKYATNFDEVTAVVAAMDEPKLAATRNYNISVVVPLFMGDTETALKNVDERIAAAEASGNAAEVQAQTAFRQAINADPYAAGLGLTLTSNASGLFSDELTKNILDKTQTGQKPTEAMRTQDAQLRSAGIVPRSEGGDGRYELAMEKAGGVPEDPTQFRAATAEELKQYNATAGQVNIKTGEFKPTGDKGPLVTNILGDAEGTFAKELAKGDAARIMATIDAGQSAARNLVELDSLSDLLGKVDTGGSAAAKAWLGTIGVDTEGLDDIQAFEAVIARMVPAQRVEGSGSSSNLDVQQFVKGLPSLIKQPGGNRIIVETLRDINEYDVAASIIAGQVAEWAQTPAADRKALEEQGLILSPAKGRKAILDLGSPTSAYRDFLKTRPKSTNAPVVIDGVIIEKIE